MNPFDGLPLDVRMAIAVYSWVGAIACGVLGLWQYEKAQRARKGPAVAPVVARASAWVFCPNGHCKVLADRDWSCPTCGAQLGDLRLLKDPATREYLVRAS